MFDGCQKLIALAVIQKRVGRRAESRETCHRILELGKKLNPKTSRPVFHRTYYILAVLDVLEGKKAGAIEWLEKSLRVGDPGGRCFRMDVGVEFDAIRDEPGFLKLLADEEAFKERIPK